MVGEPHPSKQGLKRRNHEFRQPLNGIVGEPHPSKQGLKPYLDALKRGTPEVGEPHPSKQGLKRIDVILERGGKKVGEPHPSKQGLKLNPSQSLWSVLISRRAPSIKTRIETQFLLSGMFWCGFCRRAPSIKTRIETQSGDCFETTYHESASPIHQNKD